MREYLAKTRGEEKHKSKKEKTQETDAQSQVIKEKDERISDLEKELEKG